MNSNTNKVLIRITPFIDGIQWTLMDNILEEVYTTKSASAELSLRKGIYLVKINYLNFFQQAFLSVFGDQVFEIPFQYRCPTPILDFKTTNNFYSEPAERYSQFVAGAEGAPKPDFFLFIARYEKSDPSNTPFTELMGTYSLYRIGSSGKEDEVIINQQPAHIDNENGVFCYSCHANPGLHFLHFKRKNGEANSIENKEIDRIFPVYIFEGFQTQYFIRWDEKIDFRNMRIYLSRTAFNRYDKKYCVLEKVVLSIDCNENFTFVNEDDWSVIKAQPFLASLVLVQKSLIKKRRKHIANENSTIPIIPFDEDTPHLPLADLSDWTLIENQDGDSMCLPLLTEVMSSRMYVPDKGNSIKEMLTSIKPASLLDRVYNNTHYDLLWTNFSAIDDPKDWKEIYKKLMTEKAYTDENTVVRWFKSAIGLNSSAINSTVDYLIGNVSGNANDFLNKSDYPIRKGLNAVKRMSSEFNVPPTVVIRDYDNYVKLYNEVSASDRKKGQEVAARKTKFFIQESTSHLDDENTSAEVLVDLTDTPIEKSKMETLVLEVLKNKKFNTHSNDLQKGMWGGKSEVNYYRMSAVVEESKISKYFNVKIFVRTFDDKPINKPVAFFVHDSFGFQNNMTIAMPNAEKESFINLIAYESFVAGALLPDKTELELDLNTADGFPRGFYAPDQPTL